MALAQHCNFAESPAGLEPQPTHLAQPTLAEMKGPLPYAEKWDGVEGKIQYLEK